MKRLAILTGVLLMSTNLSARKLSTDDYIERWKFTAVEQMNEYAIPASITLAQGILESASGNSNLATTANNHFGIKCHRTWDGKKFYMDDDARNECFRSYENASQSYDDHSEFLTSRSRYDKLFTLKITDYKGWAKGLKSAGYATNPKYAHLLIDIIERFDLAKFDLMSNLPSKKKEDELSIVPVENTSKTIAAKEIGESKKSVGATVNTHDVYENQWDVRYIKVKQGDTYYRIANEFKLGLWQLYKYNDLGQRDVLREGEIIYLDPKRRKASKGCTVFLCTRETTLRDISQEQGLRLKKLMKMNYIDSPDKKLPSGTKVILR